MPTTPEMAGGVDLNPDALPDLYEQVELFVNCIEYEIRVAESKGDDEGARLKSLTLFNARAALSKASPNA